MVQQASVWHIGPAMAIRGPGSFGGEWRMLIHYDNSSILIYIYLYIIIFINPLSSISQTHGLTHFPLGSSIDTLAMLPAFS